MRNRAASVACTVRPAIYCRGVSVSAGAGSLSPVAGTDGSVGRVRRGLRRGAGRILASVLELALVEIAVAIRVRGREHEVRVRARLGLGNLAVTVGVERIELGPMEPALSLSPATAAPSGISAATVSAINVFEAFMISPRLQEGLSGVDARMVSASGRPEEGCNRCARRKRANARRECGECRGAGRRTATIAAAGDGKSRRSAPT